MIEIGTVFQFPSKTTAFPHPHYPTYRRFRLVGGTPEVTTGAAGSAIKGIGVVPRNFPVSPTADENADSVDKTRPVPIALTVFTVARDRRLSRWDLVEKEDDSLTSCPEGKPRHVRGNRRRWWLRWRAGCITDVADVSGLDVVLLPGDARQPALCGMTGFCRHGVEATKEEEARARSGSSKTTFPSASLVAVSGQGLQLVLFGGC